MILLRQKIGYYCPFIHRHTCANLFFLLFLILFFTTVTILSIYLNVLSTINTDSLRALDSTPGPSFIKIQDTTQVYCYFSHVFFHLTCKIVTFRYIYETQTWHSSQKKILRVNLKSFYSLRSIRAADIQPFLLQ